MQVEHEAMEVPSEDGNGGESTQRGLQHLDSDLLLEVFSFLPQKDLVEVMCVCRPWEKTVMEASVLWKVVKVCNKWELGSSGGGREDAEGDEMIQRILNFAGKVTISRNVGLMLTRSVADMERPKLRILSLPSESVDIITLLLFLSKSLQLVSLKVDGELLGSDRIYIIHPTLQILDIQCHTPRPLAIYCPNLYHLSTVPYFTHGS